MTLILILQLISCAFFTTSFFVSIHRKIYKNQSVTANILAYIFGYLNDISKKAKDGMF